MNQKEKLLSHAHVLEILNYDSETGLFTWKIKAARWISVGAVAGHITSRNYVTIGIDGVAFKAHRLAWFYVYEVWPARIDHKDRCGTHNWISNLRVATQAQNMMNREYKSKYGRGIVKNGSGYSARIWVNAKCIYLGTFRTLNEAQEIYKEASLKHHGEFSIYADEK